MFTTLAAAMAAHATTVLSGLSQADPSPSPTIKGKDGFDINGGKADTKLTTILESLWANARLIGLFVGLIMILTGLAKAASNKRAWWLVALGLMLVIIWAAPEVIPGIASFIKRLGQ